MTTPVGQLAAEISRQLHMYAQLAEDEINVNAEDVAAEGALMLKNNSPERTGKYATGWSYKKVGKKFVVHNKKYYQLTHLLENGHVKASGGRVPARVHIKPVEEHMVDDFVERLKRGLST